MTLKIATLDAITGEYYERDMNAAELLEHEAMIAQESARVAAEVTKAAARQAVLDRLGLTEEEAQLIIGGSN